MTAPLMPKATAVWLVENTTLTFRQIGNFCELHELEVQAIADGEVAMNIVGLNPIATGQLTAEEIARCEADKSANLVAITPEGNVKALNRKNKKVLSPSQRSDKPAAILWVLKNCPEIIDSQICKLIGTTKPTIKALREGTYKDISEIRPKNPVAVGLCKEKDLENAINLSKKLSTPRKAKKKMTETKTVKKTAAKKPAAKKTAVKKTVAKKTTVKKVAAKKPVAKKAAVKKVATKKPVAKKAAVKKVATKKPVAKKAAVKKVAAKKPVAKKAAVKKVAAKKPVAKKAVVKKVAAKKSVAKKAAVKKVAAKKPVAKKAAVKKVAAKKPVAKKAAVKKVAAKKPVAKKK